MTRFCQLTLLLVTTVLCTLTACSGGGSSAETQLTSPTIAPSAVITSTATPTITSPTATPTMAPTPSPTMTPATISYVAVGDSITAGGNQYPYPNGPTPYPVLLGPEINASVDDLGIGGATTLIAEQLELNQVPANCNLLTVNLGTGDNLEITEGNETLAQFEQAYTTVLQSIKQSCPNAPVLVATVVDNSFDTYTHSKPLADQMNAFITSLPNVTVIDLANDPILANPAYYYPDGLHPLEAGQQEIAADFLPKIKATAAMRAHRSSP